MDDAIGQRRFAVIDMGDDGEVADALHAVRSSARRADYAARGCLTCGCLEDSGTSGFRRELGPYSSGMNPDAQ
jgi:hypothetical protein